MSIFIKFKELKNKTFKKENIYFFFLISFIFFLDRYSKIEILNNFKDTRVFINTFVNFDLIWNTGIGFGFFSTNSEVIYNLITALIGLVIIILFYVLLISNKTDKTIYCMIIGGAFGNFYDRLTFKAVPDFIDFHYNNFHWFTFNVADIFISVGIITFMLKSYFVKDKL